MFPVMSFRRKVKKNTVEKLRYSFIERVCEAAAALAGATTIPPPPPFTASTPSLAVVAEQVKAPH